MRPFPPDKIFAHLDRVREWAKTGRTRPITYELDMTNSCNHNCPHCFGFHPGRDSSSMSLADAKDIIGQIRDMGGRGLTFTGGGDPLVNPATLRAVEYASRLGLDIGFITNGQALSPEGTEILLRSCVWTRISLDAAGAKVFKSTHGLGPGPFARVLSNIRTMVGMKTKIRSKTTIGIGFLTCAATKRDIRAFSRLGRSLGVDYAQYRPILRINGSPDIDYSDKSILEDILQAQRDYSTGAYSVACSEHKYRMIEQGTVSRRYRECYGQNFAAVICADKKMYVCCHMRGIPKYALGDLSERSLREIWDSPEKSRIAESVDFRDCPPLCRCDAFNTILWDLKTGDRGLDDAPEDGSWTHRNFI